MDGKGDAVTRVGYTAMKVLGLEQACKPTGDREQDRIPDSHADGVVDLLEPVDIDHDDRWPDLRVSPGKAEDCFNAVNEQFAVGQTGEVVVNGIKQQPFLGSLEIGHVGERADEADNLAIGADHGARLQREPEIVAIGGSQTEILGQTAATLFDDAVV